MAEPHFSDLLRKNMTRKEFLGLMGIIVASVFGITGVIKELQSHAATAATSVEPENGTPTSPAKIITDTTASGGQAIKFGPQTGVQPTGAGITRYQDLPVKGSAGASGTNGQFSATANQANGMVSLAPGTFEVYDFADPPNDPVYGVFLRSNVTGLLGSGSGSTFLQLHPNSMTQDAPTTDTNQFSVLRIGSGKVTLQGICFPQTPQRSLYNAVVMYQATAGSLVKDVIIKGVPGNSGVPPGETFSLNNYRCDGLLLQNVELDGRDSNGNVVASSLMGNNYATDMSATDCTFHYTTYGSGFTEYMSGGAYSFTNCTFTNCALVGANFEQFQAGTITFTNCTWANNRADILLDNTQRSTVVKIINPNLSAGQKLKVVLHTVYSYDLPSKEPNLQQQSDVTLTVNGVTRNDLINFVTDY